MAPATSVTECCFINTVERHMSIHSMNEAAFTDLCSLRYEHFLMAISTTIELYTCMLGNTLVGVSLA